MMNDLNDKTWKPVKLTSIFDLQRGRESNMSMLDAGDIPLVSAKNGSNGLKSFVKNPQKLVNGNCISLNNDGDGGAGLAYYQPAKMALDTHVTALIPKINVNRDSMLFISECISGLHGFFGHGHSISNLRAKATSILIPVTNDDEPDYKYMEQYVVTIRKKKLTQYCKYVQKRIVELGDYVEIPSLSEKKWSSFKIGDLFRTNIRGKKIYMPTGALVNKRLLKNGKIPRIRVTASNNGVNGITNRINNSDFRTYINFISMSFLGSAFYHPYEASLDMKVHCLQLLDKKMTPGLGLFITVMLMNNVTGTNYGNQLSSEDLVSKKILLPVNSGKPDFEYMDQYGKNMMLKKYKQYLAFLNKA